MKILIDCRFWGVKHTGLGRYTQNLVENLLMIDRDNHYILLVQKDEFLISNFKFLNKYPISNFQFHKVNISHYSLKEQIVLPRILSKIKPDLVHFPHFNVPYFCKFPFVVTIHDLIKHYSRGMSTTTRFPWVYLIKYFGYKFIFNNGVKKAKKIIVPSNWIKKQLLEYYPKIESKKVTVIYEGINQELRIMNYELRIKNNVLNKYKIKKPYLLYIGNAYPHKNLRRLILTIKMINQSPITNHQSPINLVIVGARDVFWERINKMIYEFKAENYVRLTGFVPDAEMNILYSEAKAFVNPSLMEGFGLPGLEAMAVGCPVVCSNIPVFKEIYGKAAFYFNSKNVEEMKSSILEFLNLSNLEKNNLINRGYDQIKNYQWENTARQTLKIYESCLNLRPG